MKFDTAGDRCGPQIRPVLGHADLQHIVSLALERMQQLKLVRQRHQFLCLHRFTVFIRQYLHGVNEKLVRVIVAGLQLQNSPRSKRRHDNKVPDNRIWVVQVVLVMQDTHIFGGKFHRLDDSDWYFEQESLVHVGGIVRFYGGLMHAL